MNEVLKHYRLNRIFERGLVFSFAILTILEAAIAIAGYTQNDNLGTFRVDFNGNQQGIVSQSDPLRSNIDVDVVAGKAKIASGFNSGFFTTAPIQPASFSSWDKIKISPLVMSTQNDIKGSLYTCDPVPIFIAGFSVPAVFNAAKEINISSLNPVLYPCVRARFDMTKTTGASPELDWVEVSWDPLPVFLITENVQTNVDAGDRFTVSINYSVSFVDSNGTVIWAELPTSANGTITNFTAAYNQNPSINTVSSISNGGLYTTSGITINGTNVPANSVYWDLGKITAGQSGTLTYQLQTKNGWENGMQILTQAHVKSIRGSEVKSDNDPSTSLPDPAVTIIDSTPVPTIDKSVAGTVLINGQNYVVSAPGYSNTVTYSITMRNSSDATTVETIFNPVIEDDISDVLDKLNLICGVANPASRISNITNGGIFDSFAKTITWTNVGGALGHIDPAGSVTVSYNVDYQDCPEGPTKYINIANGTADNIAAVTDSENVIVGLDLTPRANVAKGDDINGISSTKGGNQDDNPGATQPPGDVFSYNVRFANNGAVALGDIVMADKIPAGTTFVSASIPANSGGTIYYYPKTGPQAGNAPGTPPTYTISGGGISGAGWGTTTGGNPSAVGWVAFYLGCTNSPIFPADSLSPQTNCLNMPSAVTAKITVRIDPLAGACDTALYTNKATYFVHSKSNSIGAGLFTSIVPPLHYEDDELTHVGPAMAVLNQASAITGQTNVTVGTNQTYTITISNTGNDTAKNTVVTIPTPQATINGTISYIGFVSASGGVINTASLPASITASLGDIQAGTSKIITVKYNIPPGIKNGDKISIVANVLAQDDALCAPITANLLKKSTVQSFPKLATFKNVSESVISPLDDIHYDITVRNTGSSPTTNTYVIDHVPQRTVFKQAYTTGNSPSGTAFTCTDCSVYFSTNITNLPAGLSVTNPISPATIASYFTLGTEISPGVWVPSGGVSPESVKWIAWKVDTMSLSVPVFPTNTTKKVGLTVTNDDNGSLPGSIASPIGTIISNAPAVFSSQLLQAIDNQVFTTILPDPGLRMVKTSSTDYVTAGEQFDWTIEYYNDSGNADSNAFITDTLPVGTSLVGLYNTWNYAAVTNGQSPLETSILSNASVSVVGNVVTITLSDSSGALPGLRGGPLLTLEGGTIRFRVASNTTLTSSEPPLMNTAQGCFENPSASYCISVQDDVIVANPDLWIRKFVDITDPVAGETIGYTLIVSNIGPHDANNVLIRDTLPAGLCYVSGTTSVTTPGWSLPEPSVTGSCGSAQTLEWNIVLNGPYGVGIMPGFSEDVYIRYNVQVHNSVLPGTTLTNGAHIETPLTEDDLTNNDTGRDITTPLPNPNLEKTVAATVFPGSNADFSITYSNSTKEIAHDVYIIDTIPDYDNDGTPDMAFVNNVSVNNEDFYYHVGPITASAPTFDPQDPTSNGWTASPVGTVAYVAILIGDLPGNAGPYSPRITLAAIDPDNGNNIPAGVALTNSATIYTSSIETTDTDNTGTATTSTPGIDLTIDKKGNPEGGFPGVAPGDPITYSITIGNSGSVDACGVYVTDTFSANLNEASPVQDFSTTGLVLVDDTGLPMFPHDGNGNPITGPVSVAFIHTSTGVFKWVIGNPGSNNSGDPDVCLPPGSNQTFHVYATVAPGTADETLLSNAATIGEDSTAFEDVTFNNTDSSSTVVYRPDLFITKNGLSCGADNNCGTGDDSTTQTSLGQKIQYTVTYGNQGNGSAQNPTIIETIPTGTCFLVGSVATQPGVTVDYSSNGGVSWSYNPVPDINGADCLVKNIRVSLLGPLDSSLAVGEDAVFNYFGTQNLIVTGTSDQELSLDASSFVETSPLPFQNLGGEVTSIDVNNDGLLDVVMPGRNGTGGVILNNSNTSLSFDVTPGQGYFQMPSPYDSSKIIAEDLNADGKPDFISGSVAVENMTSSGSGTIATGSVTLLGPSTQYDLFVEDFDNDGQKDVLTSGNTGGVLIYKNTSNGGALSFDTVSPVAVAPYAGRIFVNDFDDDGYPDIYMENVGVFANTTGGGSMQFDPTPVFVPLGTVQGSVIEDLNSNNKYDILTVDDTGTLTVYKNTSNASGISFSVDQVISNVTLYHKPLLADVDGDNLNEIIIGSDVDGTTNIYKNTSSGSSLSFDSPVPLVGPPTGSVVGEVEDIDGDGKKDVFIKGSGYTYNVFRNTTPLGSSVLSFGPAILPFQSSSASSTLIKPVFVDFDKNGKKDILILEAQSGTILENTSVPGNITFGKHFWLPNDNFISPMALEDFDNDSWVDIVIPGYWQSYYARNNSSFGNISFGSSTSYTGVYTVAVPMSAGIVSWDKLRVKQDIPQGADLTYALYDASCSGTPLLSQTALPNNFIDISNLAVQNMCLKVYFSSPSFLRSPVLDGWQVTYKGDSDIDFVFGVRVKDTLSSITTIDNTISISTNSDETDLSNNTATYQLSLNRVDVEVVKTVDKVSAMPGDTLTYTLSYTNHGPIDAHGVTLEDQFPVGFAYDSYTVLSGDPLTCTLDTISNKFSCVHQNDADWVLSVGEVGSIQITGLIVPSSPPTILSHSTQAEFENGDLGSYYSTTNNPGSVVASNVTVPIDLSATNINSMNLQVFDSTGGVVENCITDPSIPVTCNTSDLTNFSIVSLSPLTLHYTGAGSLDISTMVLGFDLAGGPVDNYAFGIFDTDGDMIADTYYTSTNYGATNSGVLGSPINFSQDVIFKLDSSGYGFSATSGTTVIPANADYQNSFDKGSSVCPSGVSPDWGMMTMASANTDTDNTLSIMISSDGGVSWVAYDPSGTTSIKDTLLGAGTNDNPNTLKYVVLFSRKDSSVNPELQSVTAELICPSGVSIGDVLTNTATISTITEDTNTSNNTDSVSTVIGNYANVYVTKTGPTQANINSNFTYTLTVGNSGNVDALGVTLVDVLDPNVSYVSSSVTGVSMSCTSSGQTVTCGGPSTVFPVGASGSILITVHVANDITLIQNTTILDNVVDISTDTIQTNIGDDHDEYSVPVAPLGTSSISGFVYTDANADNQKQTSELGRAGVDVYIAGKDIFSKIYGPDKNVAPQIYETLIQELVNEGLLSPGTYLFTDPYPLNYLPINPFTTSASGAWNFSGYNPGTYTVMIDQPANLTSTGSNAGYRNVDSSGSPIYQPLVDGKGSFETGLPADKKWIYGIVMGDAENAIHYDFGELDGGIGDQIFWDKNSDGTFNSSDTGISGVTVMLVRDTNSNGTFDAGEPTTSKTTDANGQYMFTGLLIGQQYIVIVTDTGGVLTTYNAILGPNPGVDNNAENPNGYIVTLSVGAPSNLTADFGYTKEDDDCTSNCGGGGSPKGRIGDQVFLDTNANGIFDPGEQGIPNVGVVVFIDLNANGSIDPSEPSLPTIFTSVNGQYSFTGLDLNNQYIVRIDDVNDVLIEYTATTGPNPGANNNSKNPFGYAITLSSSARVNLTADFGFAADILPPTGQAISIRYLIALIMLVLTGGVLYAFRNKPSPIV